MIFVIVIAESIKSFMISFESTIVVLVSSKFSVYSVEHVLLLSCVVAYGVRCSIAGGRRERETFCYSPLF
jgi:hypothetical protein